MRQNELRMVLHTVAERPGRSLGDAIRTIQKGLYKLIEPARVFADVFYNPVALSPGMFLRKGVH